LVAGKEKAVLAGIRPLAGLCLWCLARNERKWFKEIAQLPDVRKEASSESGGEDVHAKKVGRVCQV